jgi:hypothetical protein
VTPAAGVTHTDEVPPNTPEAATGVSQTPPPKDAA